MVRTVLLLGLVVGLVACFLFGCRDNSSKSTPPPLGKGTLLTFVGDQPLCDLVALRPLITGMTLTTQDGTRAVSVFPSTASIKVNFAALRDFTGVLNLASVDEGTYSTGTLTISIPQLGLFDPTQSPPIRLLTIKLASSSPKFTIDPPLQLVKDKVNALRLDLDLPGSIEVDSQGQATGNVTMNFRATRVTASGTQGFGVIDDLIGFIQRVDTFSSNPKFIGDVQVQLFSSSGPSLTVNLTNSTKVFGASAAALNQLPTGSFVEVDGFFDSDGNFVANTMEVEDQEVVEQNKVAFIGIVTSLKRGPTGQVTQFSLDVRETEPGIPFDVSDDSVVIVNVSSSTTFQFSSRATNFAGLPFDATALTTGQEVIVHGVFTKPPSMTPPPETPPPTTVAADKVYLKLQTIQGKFSSLIQAGTDDLTGAFQLTPCSILLRGTPVLVLTNAQTVFLNVAGLNELKPQPDLLVKGLPFSELQGTTVLGVVVPPGTLVVLAKQVHQLL